MKRLIWKRKTAQYTNGDLGYSGKVVCFSVDWDSSSTSEDLPHKLSSRLPGFKKIKVSHFESRGAAMKYAEGLLVMWLTAAGLQFKEDN